MKSLEKYTWPAVSIFLLLFGLACSKQDTPSASVKTPGALNVKVALTGATAQMPDGDGSGGMSIDVSAANATNYQVILPTENNKTFTLNNPSGGQVSYTFSGTAGTTVSFPVQVIAYNGSAHKDTSFSVQVYFAALQSDVDFWLTKPDKSVLFSKQNTALNFTAASNSNSNLTITVSDQQKYQTIDGFGFTFTGGSAELINSMDDAAKDNLLKELFLTEGGGIGISYLRLSIGASDLSSSAYTYDDKAGDTELKSFSIDKEKENLLPLLKKILALNPAIKIIATPWSAPAWMKSNNSLYGGGDQPGILLPEYYPVYADYFVKYIQAMQAAGITIDAVTVQNEPLNAYNNPSMLMTDTAENNFIKNYLWPAFNKHGIGTKIIVYDHNLDHPEYTHYILSDPDTYKMVDGSAYHLYAGDISTLSSIHEAFPNKNLYFTEQYTSATGDFGGDLSWHIQNLIIGATQNWSRNVLEWNLAADPQNKPHLPGGCSDCLGAVTISGGSVTKRNQSYYIIAHASKFVRPGSVRIDCSKADNLLSVAFLTPDNKKVLIVLNKSSQALSFNIRYNGKIVSPQLPAGAVGTFIW